MTAQTGTRRAGTGRAGTRRARTRRFVGTGLAGLLSVFSALSLSPAPAAAAADVAAFDFNADGYADLAVGIPGEQLGRFVDAGSVEVIYGSRRAGLTATRSQAWTRDSPGVKGVVAARDRFGSSLTSADFDGDGYADLAVGAVGQVYGSVTILYGSRSGLTARDQLLSSADVGTSDLWGLGLRAGDFNGDGRADLAVRGQDPPAGGEGFAVGVVEVLYGSSTGLTTQSAVRITRDSPGLAGDSEPGDSFGKALATGDVDGDGRDDLAVGYQVNIGARGGAYVLYGSSTGLSGLGSQHFDPETPGLLPANSNFTAPGAEVALGDFDADSHADLVLGDYDGGLRSSASCFQLGGCPGAVLVLRGTADGVTLAGRTLWSQDSPGVPGAAEVGDAFGWTAVTGDLNGDGRDDLAIGVPGEDLGASAPYDAGAVTVLYGSRRGLTGANAQTWTQNSAGIKGRSEQSDYFGRYLRISDFGHGAAADLAAAGDGEGVGLAENAGEVNVLYGSPGGVTSTDQLWSQDSPGIEGKAQTPDNFGQL